MCRSAPRNTSRSDGLFTALLKEKTESTKYKMDREGKLPRKERKEGREGERKEREREEKRRERGRKERAEEEEGRERERRGREGRKGERGSWGFGKGKLTRKTTIKVYRAKVFRIFPYL